jgi:hypothetical protein
VDEGGEGGGEKESGASVGMTCIWMDAHFSVHYQREEWVKKCISHWR